MNTAYSYLRFSHQRQINSEKLERQLEQARQYALENSLQLNEDFSFQDLGVSAFRGLNSSDGYLADFLAAVKLGFVEKNSYLLVESLDRLSRQTARKALRTLEDICDAGITVVTLIDRQKYTADRLDNDPTALLISLVIFLRANEESATKSKRIRAAWQRKIDKARNGEKVIISMITPGWIKVENKEFVIDKEKIKTVKMVFKLAELGLGSNAITTALNLNKMPTMKDRGFWNRCSVQVLLKNPSVIGWYVPHLYKVVDGVRVRTPLEPIKGYYPRVVSQKSWNIVQYYIKRRGINKHKNKPSKIAVRNIFGWLAKCPVCGYGMPRRYKKISSRGLESAYAYYLICTKSESSAGCVYQTVPYQLVEDVFLKYGAKMLEEHCLKFDKTKAVGSYKFSKHEVSLLEVRVHQICKTLGAEKLHRKRLNLQLRKLFKRVVINYNTEELEFEFSYGGRDTLDFSKSMNDTTDSTQG